MTIYWIRFLCTMRLRRSTGHLDRTIFFACHLCSSDGEQLQTVLPDATYRRIGANLVTRSLIQTLRADHLSDPHPSANPKP